jgi:hypothetical protein
MEKIPSYKNYKQDFTTKKLDEANMKVSRQLQKATEDYHQAQLEMQNIQKEFIATPKDDESKRKDLKAKLIKQNEIVKTKEKIFHQALGNEDIDDLEI